MTDRRTDRDSKRDKRREPDTHRDRERGAGSGERAQLRSPVILLSGNKVQIGRSGGLIEELYLHNAIDVPPSASRCRQLIRFDSPTLPSSAVPSTFDTWREGRERGGGGCTERWLGLEGERGGGGGGEREGMGADGRGKGMGRESGVKVGVE